MRATHVIGVTVVTVGSPTVSAWAADQASVRGCDLIRLVRSVT